MPFASSSLFVDVFTEQSLLSQSVVNTIHPTLDFLSSSSPAYRSPSLFSPHIPVLIRSQYHFYLISSTLLDILLNFQYFIETFVVSVILSFLIPYSFVIQNIHLNVSFSKTRPNFFPCASFVASLGPVNKCRSYYSLVRFPLEHQVDYLVPNNSRHAVPVF